MSEEKRPVYVSSSDLEAERNQQADTGGSAAPPAQGAVPSMPPLEPPRGAPPPAGRPEWLRLGLAALCGALFASAIFLVVLLTRDSHPPRRGAGAVAGDVSNSGPASPARPSQAPARQGPLGRSLFGKSFKDMMRDMQKQMRSFGRGFGGRGFTFSLGGNDIPLSVEEEPDAVIVTARVKGAIQGKFDIKVQGREFTLGGRRQVGQGGFQATMSFRQSIMLPAEVDSGAMTSKFENGVLRVRLPKKK